MAKEVVAPLLTNTAPTTNSCTKIMPLTPCPISKQGDPWTKDLCWCTWKKHMHQKSKLQLPPRISLIQVCQTCRILNHKNLSWLQEMHVRVIESSFQMQKNNFKTWGVYLLTMPPLLISCLAANYSNWQVNHRWSSYCCGHIHIHKNQCFWFA